MIIPLPFLFQPGWMTGNRLPEKRSKPKKRWIETIHHCGLKTSGWWIGAKLLLRINGSWLETSLGIMNPKRKGWSSLKPDSPMPGVPSTARMILRDKYRIGSDNWKDACPSGVWGPFIPAPGNCNPWWDHRVCLRGITS